MATHASILAWKIPWTEAPGGLQSMGWQRVGQEQLNTYECTSLLTSSPLALNGFAEESGSEQQGAL